MKKIKIIKENESCDCNIGDVVISDSRGEGPDCEHCGNLGPFEPVISNGGTYYCLSCMDANGDDEEEGLYDLTKNDLKLIEAECLKREKAYIKKRYNQLFPTKK